MPLRLPRRQDGFTYLGLIILVTVIGLVGAATLKIEALLQRAAAEEELLAAGAAFSAALESYAAATPQGQPPQPPSLQELLKDPRTPGVRRHLRKIFIDPITGGTEWGIVWLGEHAGVVGVYSRSRARPLKIGNFDPRFNGFANREHFSDWKFVAANRPALPLAPAGSGAPPAPSLFSPIQPQAPEPAPLAPPVAGQPVLMELAPPPLPDPPREEAQPDDPPPAIEE